MASQPTGAHQRRWPGLALGAAAGAAWFSSFGAQLIPPTRLEPVMRGDWSKEVLGWLMFRHAAPALPLGALPNLLYPVGTTVGFSDSVPLVCLLLRPIQALLPGDFQFVGLVLLACFAGMGAAGAWLTSAVSERVEHQALGGVCFALAPALTRRVEHTALCAQGLLVAMLWLALAPCPDGPAARRRLAASIGLAALSAAIHPYLAVMMAALGVAVCVRLAWDGRHLSAWAAAAGAAAQLLAPALVLWALGFFSGGVDPSAGGAGVYTADLATFFNPWEYSRFFAARPMAPGQTEGFAYLGLGGLLLIAAAAGSLFLRRREVRSLPFRRLGPPVAVAVGLFAIALGRQPTFFGRPLGDLGALWSPVAWALSAFRSTGRFVWPLMYLALGFGVLGVIWAWRHRPSVATAALAACAVLQLSELSTRSALPEEDSQLLRLSDPRWSQLSGYRHLELISPQVWMACGDPAAYRAPLVVSLTYLAYQRGLTFNSGYVTRNASGQGRACAEEEAAVLGGKLEPDAIYVVEPRHLARLKELGASCAKLDGLDVCVAAGAQNPL